MMWPIHFWVEFYASILSFFIMTFIDENYLMFLSVVSIVNMLLLAIIIVFLPFHRASFEVFITPSFNRFSVFSDFFWFILFFFWFFFWIFFWFFFWFFFWIFLLVYLNFFMSFLFCFSFDFLFFSCFFISLCVCFFINLY